MAAYSDVVFLSMPPTVQHILICLEPDQLSSKSTKENLLGDVAQSSLLCL